MHVISFVKTFLLLDLLCHANAINPKIIANLYFNLSKTKPRLHGIFFLQVIEHVSNH